MPTVMTMYGLRVVIYPNDHRPAHVHIIGNDCEAVFHLHCASKEVPELRENYGFSRKALIKIANALTDSQSALCIEWRQIHGYY